MDSILYSNSKQFNFLKNAFFAGKLHHAYIFYGPDSLGKLSFAREFARFIQCKNNSKGQPCGECVNCKDGIADIYIVFSEHTKKISIEDIRGAKRFLDFSALSENKKILIINGEHNMTEEAKEILLKTLEEPPSQSLIILLSSDKESLTETIISRCVSIFFPFLKKDLIKEKSDLKFFNSNFFDIAYALNLDNVQITEDSEEKNGKEILEKYEEAVKELEILISGNIFSSLANAKKISENDNFEQKIKYWIAILYTVYLYKEGIGSFGEKEKAIFSNLEKRLTYSKIEDILSKLLYIFEILDTNVSKRVLLENFILQM